MLYQSDNFRFIRLSGSLSLEQHVISADYTYPFKFHPLSCKIDPITESPVCTMNACTLSINCASLHALYWFKRFQPIDNSLCAERYNQQESELISIQTLCSSNKFSDKLLFFFHDDHKTISYLVRLYSDILINGHLDFLSAMVYMTSQLHIINSISNRVVLYLIPKYCW